MTQHADALQEAGAFAGGGRQAPLQEAGAFAGGGGHAQAICWHTVAWARQPARLPVAKSYRITEWKLQKGSGGQTGTPGRPIDHPPEPLPARLKFGSPYITSKIQL